MSFKELIDLSVLYEYKELDLWRVESRLSESGIYDCIWFWSNDGELPNSIIYRNE